MSAEPQELEGIVLGILGRPKDRGVPTMAIIVSISERHCVIDCLPSRIENSVKRQTTRLQLHLNESKLRMCTTQQGQRVRRQDVEEKELKCVQL